MHERVEKRVYLTNLRQLGFGECRRFGGGLVKGVIFWGISRFVPPQGETELPFDYDDAEAQPDDLSANFHEYHAAWQSQFNEAGYRPVGWQKIRSSRDPNHIDSGSGIYLSADSRLIGILNLIIVADETKPSGIRVTEGCSVIAHLDDHRTITTTNLGIYLDPRHSSRRPRRSLRPHCWRLARDPRRDARGRPPEFSPPPRRSAALRFEPGADGSRHRYRAKRPSRRNVSTCRRVLARFISHVCE